MALAAYRAQIEAETAPAGGDAQGGEQGADAVRGVGSSTLATLRAAQPAMAAVSRSSGFRAAEDAGAGPGNAADRIRKAMQSADAAEKDVRAHFEKSCEAIPDPDAVVAQIDRYD